MRRPTEFASSGAGPGYVEVADEPLHKEVYADRYFRAYCATLSPGQATGYHRHSEDTLYVVIKGGIMRTIGFKGAGRSSMVFPRSFPLYRQLWLALQNGVTGSAYLPDGLSFFMPTGNRSIVHRAVASPRNRGEVCLMGIEIRHGLAGRLSSARNALSWQPDYDRVPFGVFTRLFAPGATERIAAPGYHLFLLCENGSLEIAPESTHGQNGESRRLATGDFLCFSGDNLALLRNAGDVTAAVLVIADPA
ncbi:MAG: hypothetical protein JXA21_25250 [Anaerolineae bacterium]|nr:hypothetical protein [Anaerolineae bacterium]